MKKILTAILLICSFAGFGQYVEITTPSPKYGCPGKTHDVTIGVKNVSMFNITPGNAIDIVISVNTTPTTNYSEHYTGGFAPNQTHYITIPSVPFGSSDMTYTLTGTASFNYFGPQVFNFSATYDAKTPSDLVITENPAHTITVSTALDVYSVRYYLNGSSTVDNETTATTYTPSAAGSYTAKAYDPVNGCISANPSNAVSITPKTTPVITFGALSAVNADNADIDPGATSTNTATAITYTSSNTSVATIVGGQIHIVGGGTTTITASQAADADHFAAVDVQQSLTVNKLTATITFGALSNVTVGDADYAPGATSTSNAAITYTSSNTSVATIVSGQIHIVGAGTTTITASQASNAMYNAATDVPQSLTVNAAPTATKEALASLVKIYPNPASDVLYVELQNNTISTGDVIISNMMGMEAARTKFSNQGNSTRAEVSLVNLPKGMYVLLIETNAGVVSQKIEKK